MQATLHTMHEENFLLFAGNPENQQLGKARCLDKAAWRHLWRHQGNYEAALKPGAASEAGAEPGYGGRGDVGLIRTLWLWGVSRRGQLEVSVRERRTLVWEEKESSCDGI